MTNLNLTILPISKLEDIINAVYNNSNPVGMGYLHYVEETNLQDDEMSILVEQFEDTGSVYLDYLKGRCCKVIVRKENDDELSITITKDNWTDHSQPEIDRFFEDIK